MTAKPKTYQQMADELNGLVEWFESDQANLDEAVAKYEQGDGFAQANGNSPKNGRKSGQKNRRQI